MPNTTNFNWTTPADTDLVKDGALAIRTLANGIDTSLVDLKGGTTGQYLVKNSNTDLDYVWSTLSAGGMTLISQTVASANSSISFSSLGNYKQLLLIYSGIRHSTTGSSFALRLNNSSSANRYQGHSTKTNTTTLTSQGFGGTSILFSGDSNDVAPFGINAISTVYGNTTDVNGAFLLDNYTSTTKYKSFNGTVGYYNDTGGYHSSAFYNGAYMNTEAITSIDIVRLSGTATISNIDDSTIRLYGIN